ncbi:MAG: hypothetical protein ACOYD9_03980 [Pyramidobacter sp.]|jgi:hypothetical protein
MDDFEKQIPLTVRSLMRSINRPDYPDYITRLLAQVKGWLTKTFVIDGVELPYWEALDDDPEALYEELSWIESQAALLPSAVPPEPMPEAVVLYLGEADLRDAMRLAVDYSLIFSKNRCRRVWIVSDCWIPFDIYEYADHIKAMAEKGVTLRFLVVTPWGWVELPAAAVGKIQFPGSSASDSGSGRSRRKKEDD